MKKTSLFLFAPMLFLTVLLVGCGGQQPAKVKQDNSSPVGSVTGRIFNQNTNAPLPNAKAYVIVNGNYQIATASQQGTYTLSNLPLGSAYTITYTAAGYASPIYNISLDVNASQFPQGNAVVQKNVGMYSLSAKITGTVFNGITGGCPSTTGLQGATVMIDFRNIGNGNPFVGFDITKTTTTDAAGKYTISDLPASMTGRFQGQTPSIPVWAYIITTTDNKYHIFYEYLNGLYPNAVTLISDICVN